MSKKKFKDIRYDYYEEDDAAFARSKKKIKEERQRKAQRNMKNAFRSKNLDAILSFDDD